MLSNTVDGSINWVHVTVLIPNVKMHRPFYLATPFLGLYPTENHLYKYISTYVQGRSNAVLFVFMK